MKLSDILKTNKKRSNKMDITIGCVICGKTRKVNKIEWDEGKIFTCEVCLGERFKRNMNINESYGTYNKDAFTNINDETKTINEVQARQLRDMLQKVKYLISDIEQKII
jgi:hypothetical protein